MHVQIRGKDVGEGYVDEKGRVHIGEEYAGKFVEFAVLNGSELEKTTVKQDKKGEYYNNHNGKKWDYARNAVLERDSEMCLSCGISQEEHIGDDERFGGLHVHHVDPVRTFEKPEDAHEMNNLVTLCDKHHREAEIHGLLSVCAKHEIPKSVQSRL